MEQLIAGAIRGNARLGCPLSHLTGDAKTYIEALNAIEAEDPRRVNRAEAQRGLRTLGVKVHVTTVQDHFNQNCRCAGK